MTGIAELRDLVARLEASQALHREKVAQLEDLVRKFTEYNARAVVMLEQLAIERAFWEKVMDELVRLGVIPRPKFRPVLVERDKVPPAS